MMKLWRYDPDVRRLWVGGCRIHHGLIGAVTVVVGVPVGVALMWHDWKDRWWINDR